MIISSEIHHNKGTTGVLAMAGPVDDLSRVSHNLMGSISALLMCEHMLGKELFAHPELAKDDLLVTTVSLLKEAAEQIRSQGEEVKRLSDSLKQQSLHFSAVQVAS